MFVIICINTRRSCWFATVFMMMYEILKFVNSNKKFKPIFKLVVIQLSYLNDEILEALCSDLLGILVFINCQKSFDKIGCTKLTQKFKVVVFPWSFCYLALDAISWVVCRGMTICILLYLQCHKICHKDRCSYVGKRKIIHTTTSREILKKILNNVEVIF